MIHIPAILIMTLPALQNAAVPNAGEKPTVITGTVYDMETGRALPDVNISVRGTPYGTTTNETGRFGLTGLENETVVLKISMIGYQTKNVTLDPDSRSGAPLKIGLNSTVLQLRGVSVTGERHHDVLREPALESRSLAASTTRISRKIIEKQNAETLVDAMRYAPGGWTETRGRKVKQFFSVRGQRYPYPEYAINGAWQREFHELPYFFFASGIESIEIVRSSAAFLTGLSGLAGIVKVSTRLYAKPVTTLQGEYGTFDGYRTQLAHGATRGRFSYAAGAGLQGTQGPPNKHAMERIGNFYVRMLYKPDPAWTMDLNLFYIRGKRRPAQAVPPAAKKFRTALWEFAPVNAAMAHLKASWRPALDYSSELVLSFARRDPVLVVTDPETGHQSRTPEKDYEYGLNWIHAWRLSRRHTLRVSGVYNRWRAPNGKRFYVGRPSDLETFAAAVVNEHRMGRCVLDGGVKWARTFTHEYGAFHIDGSPKGFARVMPVRDTWEPPVLNFYLGGVYTVRPWMSLFANMAAGQIKPRHGILNTNLEAPGNETRLKVDVGLEARWDRIGQMTITGFRVYRFNGLVLSGQTFERNGRIMELYLNRDQGRTGVEWEGRSALLFRHYEFFANAVVMDAWKNQGEGRTSNPEIPNVIVGGGLFAEFNRFDVNFFYKHISGYQSTRFAAPQNGTVAAQPLGDFLILDATAGWSFGRLKNLRLYIDIRNITDRRYSTVVGYPDDGRQIRLGGRLNIY